MRRQMLLGLMLAVLWGGSVAAQVTRHSGSVEIQGTGAQALDNAGGAQFGSGNVNLIGIDGKLNGPLSTTIIDDLSGANLTALPAGQLTGSIADARVQASNVTQHVGSIDHDALLNFVADEHVAHGGVTLTAGTGMTGGGTIAASRTFDVAGGNCITANANDVAVTTNCIASADILDGTILTGDIGTDTGDRRSQIEEDESMTTVQRAVIVIVVGVSTTMVSAQPPALTTEQRAMVRLNVEAERLANALQDALEQVHDLQVQVNALTRAKNILRLSILREYSTPKKPGFVFDWSVGENGQRLGLVPVAEEPDP